MKKEVESQTTVTTISFTVGTWMLLLFALWVMAITALTMWNTYVVHFEYSSGEIYDTDATEKLNKVQEKLDINEKRRMEREMSKVSD